MELMVVTAPVTQEQLVDQDSYTTEIVSSAAPLPIKNENLQAGQSTLLCHAL